jgi:hypothetical protein
MLCMVLACAGSPAAADTPSPSAAPNLRSPGPYPAPQAASGPADAVLLRAVREAEGAVRKAAEAAAEIARRRAEPRYAEAWKDEAPEGIVAAASRAIAAARERLERGKNLGQLRDLQEATRLATSARKDLVALAGRLEDQLARLAVRDLLIERAGRDARRQTQEKAARENTATKKAAAEKAPAQTAADAKAAAERATAERVAAEKVAADRVAAERVGAEKVAAEKVAADRLAAEQAIATRLVRKQETARREAESRRLAKARQPGPPSELRAAARALFRADYEGVVQLLAGLNFAERRATVTAALLLAAARYALFLEGGEKDLRLRRQAGESASTCRRLAPALSPDPKLFSPRFVQFFRSAG